ncbi:MAG: hypothetical protein LBM62_04950 [Mediterranea sp.]|jgi:outer membrane lipoprotein-sorting protein|nr:hypothetical protein [Mediterranea sp.]
MRTNILLIIGLIALLPLSAQTPRKVLDRTAETLRREAPLAVEMNVGSFLLKGDKFVLDMGDTQTWFDGRTQWTYVAANNEVTVITPTPQELQGINPYSWLSLYKQGYKLTLTTLPRSYEVLMQSTDPRNDLKQIRLSIDRGSYLPQSIHTTLGSGETFLITVKKCRTRQSLPDTRFVFDKKAYPDVEVIDLRE